MAADFSKNGISIKGIQALMQALKNNDTLETFILDTNSIGDDGAEAIAQHMASAYRPLSDGTLHACLLSRAHSRPVPAALVLQDGQLLPPS